MRFLIAAALVLLSLCGCSSPIGVHNSDDFEYGDSSSVVKSKFPGKLIEHESIYLVGTTSVDSKSYGVTFTFFKDQLVSMFLCAKSHSNGKSADNNSMEINRDSDWDSNLEYENIQQKLVVKYGEGKLINPVNKFLVWDLPDDELALWVHDGIVGIQYQVNRETELGKAWQGKDQGGIDDALKNDF